jgi:hypothetical protein
MTLTRHPLLTVLLLVLVALSTIALLELWRVAIARGDAPVAAVIDAGGEPAAAPTVPSAADVAAPPAIAAPATPAPASSGPAAPPPPAAIVRPVDLDALVAIGAAAGPLAIALQPLVGLLAMIGALRRRAPWLAAPRALAIAAVVIADLVVLGPAIHAGTITWIGALFAIAVNAGQIRYPDMLHRSSADGGAAGGELAARAGAIALVAMIAMVTIAGCRPPPAAQGETTPHRTWVQDLVDGIRAAREVVCELPRQNPAAAPNRLGEALGDAQVVLCAPPAPAPVTAAGGG